MKSEWGVYWDCDLFLWALCLLFIFWQRCICVEFLYFGLRFCYSKASVEKAPDVFHLQGIMDLGDQCNQLLKEMKEDMKMLCNSSMGKKVDWKADGFFMKLQDTNNHIYVYQHRHHHAACSSVMYSHLVSAFTIQPKHVSLCSTCNHPNHFHLQPFFFDNRYLMDYYEKLIAEGKADVTPLLDELNKIEGDARRSKIDPELEFERPNSLVNNWKENDWSRRLVVGIRKTFVIEATYSAEMVRFGDLLDTLRVNCDTTCFLFRGFPDIIIHRRCAVVGSGANYDEHAVIEDLGATMSGGEDSVLENSFQRNPLHGFSDSALPEKVGKLFAGLHILLVAKILRKIYKAKNIYHRFEVKGVLIDKSAATVQCYLSVDLTNNGTMLNIELIDHMGSYLTPESLCYHIRAITGL